MIHTILKACQEYSSFVIDPANRDISDSHIDRLEDAIEDVYLLDAYPIVTTPERVIVDGQHRFRMAKNLTIPFYFISGDGISIEDVALANSNTEKYRIEDALHVYASMEMAPYVLLREFCEMYPGIRMFIMAKWLSLNFNTSDFMNGAYTVDRQEYAGVLARWALDFAEHQKTFLASPAYRSSLELLYRTPLYDHGRMVEKLERLPRRLVRCGTVEEAMSVIDEIYNYNARTHRFDLKSTRRTDLKSTVDKATPHVENSFEKPIRGIVNSQDWKIYKECDLGKFSTHSSARPIRNVAKLAASIAKHDLLQFYPIIVDRDFVVYDGQRRLEAARLLGVPIYYMVLQNMSMWMIAKAGGIAKSWGYRDYLKHYVSLQYPEYIQVNALLNKHRVLSISFFTHCGDVSPNATATAFKIGAYKIPHPFADQVIGILNQINDFQVASSTVFQRVIISLYSKHQGPEFSRRVVEAVNSNAINISLPRAQLEKDTIEMYNKGLRQSNRIT